MKTLILTSLFLLSACSSEPKFHYKECVIIISGFYVGQKGQIESYYQIDSFHEIIYKIVGSSPFYIKESQLTVVNCEEVL